MTAVVRISHFFFYFRRLKFVDVTSLYECVFVMFVLFEQNVDVLAMSVWVCANEWTRFFFSYIKFLATGQKMKSFVLKSFSSKLIASNCDKFFLLFFPLFVQSIQTFTKVCMCMSVNVRVNENVFSSNRIITEHKTFPDVLTSVFFLSWFLFFRGRKSFLFRFLYFHSHLSLALCSPVKEHLFRAVNIILSTISKCQKFLCKKKTSKSEK